MKVMKNVALLCALIPNITFAQSTDFQHSTEIREMVRALLSGANRAYASMGKPDFICLDNMSTNDKYVDEVLQKIQQNFASAPNAKNDWKELRQMLHSDSGQKYVQAFIAVQNAKNSESSTKKILPNDLDTPRFKLLLSSLITHVYFANDSSLRKAYQDPQCMLEHSRK